MLSNNKIIENMIMILDYMLSKTEQETSFNLLQKELLTKKDKLLSSNYSDRLSLGFKSLAHQVYDNFWNTKNMYRDLVALDNLQRRYNAHDDMPKFIGVADMLNFLSEFNS